MILYHGSLDRKTFGSLGISAFTNFFFRKLLFVWSHMINTFFKKKVFICEHVSFLFQLKTVTVRDFSAFQNEKENIYSFVYASKHISSLLYYWLPLYWHYTTIVKNL
jgi:hypothetical protein